MSADLFLDLGNTRIKYWMCEGTAVRSAGVINYSDLDSQLAALYALTPPATVTVAAVADEACVRMLVSRHQALSDIAIERCVVTAEACGLRCAYDQPVTLGVDRWLAMLGARARISESPLMVVDVGTATTVDLISCAGQHLGGYIVSGPGLAVEGLLAGTARIRLSFAGDWTGSVAPGRCTADAVLNGAMLVQVSLINECFQRFEVEHPESRLILAGGGAKTLVPFLKTEATLQEDLVLKGMQVSRAAGLLKPLT